MNNNRNQWVIIEGQHNLPDEDIFYDVKLKNGETKKLKFSHHLPSSIKYWMENVEKYYIIK